mmetsp:Transcript_81844/g.265101  ORF Transcript_81844/g.265101 Transcript_81844/m.265101 type:complete len:208 (+) Transcript_81844:1301-1924(+)
MLVWILERTASKGEWPHSAGRAPTSLQACRLRMLSNCTRRVSCSKRCAKCPAQCRTRCDSCFVSFAIVSSRASIPGRMSCSSHLSGCLPTRHPWSCRRNGSGPTSWKKGARCSDSACQIWSMSWMSFEKTSSVRPWRLAARVRAGRSWWRRRIAFGRRPHSCKRAWASTPRSSGKSPQRTLTSRASCGPAAETWSNPGRMHPRHLTT